jgi:hypothetical protein
VQHASSRRRRCWASLNDQDIDLLRQTPNNKKNKDGDDGNCNQDETTTTTTTTTPTTLLSSSQFLVTEDAVWLLPPVLSIMAFCYYTETAKAFHWLVDAWSGHTWTSADGGKYMMEIVRPVLNGPVTLAVSILFGTLVSMTIQTLYNRQTSLHSNYVSTVEEVRELYVMMQTFPEPYKSEGQAWLSRFLDETLDDLVVSNKYSNNHQEQVTSPTTSTTTRNTTTLRKKQTTRLLQLLNRLSQDKDQCPPYIGQVYSGVNRLKELRSEFLATFQTVFAPAHYINIVILAATLLFVFLLETDQTTLQFLLGFQLSICWALLVGTFSMLSAVIYDLASPFTGIFSIMERSQVRIADMKQYAFSSSEDDDDAAVE